jgi:proteasome accessory factor A
MRPEGTKERAVPKLVGADFELGNFILGRERQGGTGSEAARALLAEIDGVEARPGGRIRWLSGGFTWGDPQDQGRKFLPANGGCAYIDLDHLELCIPEVRSAFDHAAASAAMLRIAQAARARANARLPAGLRLQVLANNSDGQSNSYGSHLSFLVSRALLEDLLERRPHYLHFLATHQLSSLVYAGQGKVGSENGRPAVAYQLSQRADFLETLLGLQTTYRRPVVNSRDESLCGTSPSLARLHVIFYDQTLCPGASVLKVGAMQIVLALLEAEVLDPRLAIDEPVAAAVAFSHDPSLRTAVRLVGGSRASALEIQQRIHELALRHHAAHGLETVPRAAEILTLWGDTLAKLAAGDLDALAGRLDWVLKLRLLQRALAQQPSLDWSAPELRHLDQLYASLDPDEGLFWPHLASGLVEPWVSEAEVARLTSEPPDDTRAFARAMLLRHLEPREIVLVDWDRVVVEKARPYERIEIALDDPLGSTRAETAALFENPEPKESRHEHPSA